MFSFSFVYVQDTKKELEVKKKKAVKGNTFPELYFFMSFPLKQAFSVKKQVVLR